ncbi:MAG: Gfo/Idh/MocA family oxidoreductase [Candidatus Nitrosopelagicus sp.]|nr:Gfo/Idh/MocA family oxidoreductase [Candidatus Nitrosopelagicus sp.]
MKVAIIGIGYWGKKHVEEYNQLGHDIIICDNDEKNVSECKEKFPFVNVKTLEQLLGDTEIKAVSICTPNETHFQIAKKCLESNKHVFLEKPISTNLENADSLRKLSENNNLVLQIGHLYRFNNSIKKAKEILSDISFGDVHSVYFSWTNFEQIFQNRGVILDLGIHPIDIIDYIFGGNSKNIKCRGWGIRQDNPEFAIINYQLHTTDNRIIFVNIELSWINPIKKREMIVLSNDNTLKVQCVEQTLTLINNLSKNQDEITITPNNTIQDELHFFINSCETQKMISPPYPNSEIAKNILEVVLQAEIENSDKK